MQNSSIDFERGQLAGSYEVVYRNKSEFDAKISAMIEDGKERLQVISDFDFTLTCYYQSDGESRSASCHMVLEHSTGLLPDSYLINAKALQEYYYPIEQDPNMDHEVKFKHMEDWVNKHNELFMTSGLTANIINTAVDNSIKDGKFRVRDGIKELFTTMKNNNIPCLIFSAGITNVLESALKRSLSSSIVSTSTISTDGEVDGDDVNATVLSDNVNIISNRCLFDDADAKGNGKLVGFSTPVLHVYNKSCVNEFLIKNNHFTINTINRKYNNILLFGDSLGDIKMSHGLENHTIINNIIKIGFLNDKYKCNDQLNTYLSESNYDIVIFGDPGLGVQQYILNLIINGYGSK